MPEKSSRFRSEPQVVYKFKSSKPSFKKGRGRGFGKGRPGGRPGGRRKGPPRKRYPQEVFNKAKELNKENGIPFHWALKVAAGHVSLSDVVKKMLFKEKVAKLAKKERIPKRLAADIISKDVAAEDIALRFRARQHVKRHRNDSILEESYRNKSKVSLFVDPEMFMTGDVIKLEKYQFNFLPTDGEVITLPKIKVNFACSTDDKAKFEELQQLRDEDVAAQKLEPEPRPTYRTHFKHRQLQALLETQAEFELVTRRGLTLAGVLKGYGLYELKMELANGALISVFRHAIHELNELGEAGE